MVEEIVIALVVHHTRVEAETIAFSSGVDTESNDKTGVYVSDIHNGDWIKVRNVDLGKNGPRKVSASLASALRGGAVDHCPCSSPHPHGL